MNIPSAGLTHAHQISDEHRTVLQVDNDCMLLYYKNMWNFYVINYESTEFCRSIWFKFNFSTFDLLKPSFRWEPCCMWVFKVASRSNVNTRRILSSPFQSAQFWQKKNNKTQNNFYFSVNKIMSSSDDEELSANYSSESLELKGFLSKWTNCKLWIYELMENKIHINKERKRITHT